MEFAAVVPVVPTLTPPSGMTWPGVHMPRRHSSFPRNEAAIGAVPGVVKAARRALLPAMPTREEILILGLTAGVLGSLVGGLMLGVGLGLATNGAHVGWLLVLPAAPLSGLIGYILARKLAARVPK